MAVTWPRQARVRGADTTSKLGAVEAAIGGALAAAAAQSVSTPLDVVRTRVMTGEAAGEGEGGGDDAYAGVCGVGRCMRDVAEDEGVAALYAGVVPKVISSSQNLHCMRLQRRIHEMRHRTIRWHRSYGDH